MNNMELREMTIEELELTDGGIGILASFLIGAAIGGVVVGGGYAICQAIK